MGLDEVGDTDVGLNDGADVGLDVGKNEGLSVGNVGLPVGKCVVGRTEGDREGLWLGAADVGRNDGFGVGLVGALLGP